METLELVNRLEENLEEFAYKIQECYENHMGVIREYSSMIDRCNVNNEVESVRKLYNECLSKIPE